MKYYAHIPATRDRLTMHQSIVNRQSPESVLLEHVVRCIFPATTIAAFLNFFGDTGVRNVEGKHNSSWLVGAGKLKPPAMLAEGLGFTGRLSRLQRREQTIDTCLDVRNLIGVLLALDFTGQNLLQPGTHA